MDDPRSVMRRRQGQPVPVWFGLFFAAFGGTFAVVGIRAVLSTGLEEPAVLLFPAVGLFFAAIGIVLAVSSVRRSRRLADPHGLALPVARPSADGRYRFRRTFGRVVLDALVQPIGAVGFGVAAVVFLGQVGSDARAFAAVVLCGIFAALLGAGTVASWRQGLRRSVLEVGSDGIWTAATGRLRWADVREVRIEDAGLVRSGRVRSRSSGYRRLVIEPRDASLAGRAPGGAARTVAQVYVEFLKAFAPRARLNDLGAMSPFGVYEYELTVPLETVVQTIAPHVPVLDAEGRFVRSEDEARFGAPATPPAARDRPTTSLETTVRFDRRPHLMPAAVAQVASSVAFVVGPALVSAVFALALFSSGQGLPLEILVPVGLVAAFFLAAGLRPLLNAVLRLDEARGPRTLLTVGPDGIGIRDGRPIPWSGVAAVRLGRAELVEGDEGHHDRPRLEIVPVDARRLAERSGIERTTDRLGRGLRRMWPWGDRSVVPEAFSIDLDVLDADPDDVIDLIDAHRRVEVVD